MGLSLYGSKDQPRHPVAALSSRMIYYPVVQLVTRLAAAWMEFAYPANANTTDDDPQHEHTTGYQIANLLYSVSGPSAGIGFFIIFLYMQPAAWTHLKTRLIYCQETDPLYYSPTNTLKADILRESHSVSINGIGEGSDTSSSVDGMEYAVSVSVSDDGTSSNAMHWGAQRFRENDPLSRTTSR